MSLVTPDPGLLFWMTVIFGVVFFLLAKFGFPVITKSVEKRNDSIRKSLREAEEAERKMQALARQQELLIEKTRKEQRAVVREASRMKKQILASAEEEARTEAAAILSKARNEIEVEKERALRDIRKSVALISLKVSERVMRREFEKDDAQIRYLNQIVDEISLQDPNFRESSKSTKAN